MTASVAGARWWRSQPVAELLCVMRENHACLIIFHLILIHARRRDETWAPLVLRLLSSFRTSPTVEDSTISVHVSVLEYSHRDNRKNVHRSK